MTFNSEKIRKIRKISIFFEFSEIKMVSILDIRSKESEHFFRKKQCLILWHFGLKLFQNHIKKLPVMRCPIVYPLMPFPNNLKSNFLNKLRLLDESANLCRLSQSIAVILERIQLFYASNSSKILAN